jgi:oligosaccharide reducing-end xylanase
MQNSFVRPMVLGLATLTLMLGCSQQPSDQPMSAVRPQGTALLHQEAESMTNGGGCTGIQATQVIYYCNNDATYNSYTFAQSGRFSITLRGASSNSTTAGISLLVGGAKVGTASFSGTTFSNQTIIFDTTTTGAKEIRLKEESDNGSNDTVIDFYDLAYEGVTPPPPPPPVPASTGAAVSGTYRNLFKEWNASITDAQITAKINSYWDSLFANTDDTKRVYYPAGSNANGALAYILDTGNSDIRSEGMSYGMMIAVQMNKQSEFKALWNYAKSILQHKTTARSGYFAWQVGTGGNIMDPNPASDGEEYFATALLFAGNRWGNGTGIYNYTAEANAILNTMLHKEDMNGGVVDSIYNMFNKTQKQVVFVPYATSANFTDPSYHLPAFYEVWAREASGYNGQQAADRQFWRDAATTSRAFFTQTTNATTGLNPDYAEFSGVPNNTGSHGEFRFDAWRTAVNWSVDNAWWASDATERTLTNKLHSFFTGQGVSSYFNQYSLAGAALSSDRSPGLIASNGAAALAATNVQAWKFVEAQWNLTPPTGQYRYYDGLLSFMGLLHASGSFKAYLAGGTTVTPPTAPSALSSSAVSSSQINLAWTDNSTNESGFLVERKTGAAGTWAQIATAAANATSYQSTGLTASTNYVYRIRATNSAGSSAYTAETNATTQAVSTTIPTAPSALSSSAVSSSQINLAWTDNSTNESGFLVERKTGAAGTWAQIATTAANATSYQSTGLTASTNYVYRIRATNSVGSSAYTAETNATTQALSNTNPYNQLEAEGLSSQNATTTTTADGGTVVNFSGSSSYIVLNGLQFGAAGAGSVQFRASTPGFGVNLQVRIGSATASPVCTVYPDGNSVWHLKSNSCFPKITGTQNIYITTTAAISINWLQFLP